MKKLTLKISILFFCAILLSSFSYNDTDSNSTSISRKKIAVLLPLTGKHKPFGVKMIKGIELASNIFSSDGAGDIEYLIKDYSSDETKLGAIINEVDKDNVIAIIGPTGTQACRTANAKGIPTIIFSQENPPFKKDSCCFGNFLTIENQVKTLLVAAQDSGITRFAILSPSNQFGVMFKDEFVKTAPAYGIQTVLIKEYKDDTKDFASIVRTLKESMRKLKSKDRKIKTPIDALLIPDSAKNASIIAAYLTTYGIISVRLFGPSLWDTPDLIRFGGKNIEGATFVSGFYLESSAINVRDFISTFTSTYEMTPSIWEASAYDSARIIRELILKGNDTPDKLRVAISTIKGYQGATGVISFDENGATKKELTVLRITDGTVTEVFK